jgi:hypothetical protein
MQRLFMLLFLSVGSPVFAQIPKLLLNATNETYVKQNFTAGSIRPGVYQFGVNVGDLDVLVIPFGSKYIVQYIYGVWEKSYYTREYIRLHKYGTFNIVSADSNLLRFGPFRAQFMNYEKSQKGLILYGDLLKNIPFHKDTAVLGFYVSNIERYYAEPELYELSTELKSPDFFRKKSNHNLEIMHHTLYAKYGQVFKLGGELDAYFRKKDWYEPTLLQVAEFFTDIEKANLKLLEKEESRRVPSGRESDERE